MTPQHSEVGAAGRYREERRRMAMLIFPHCVAAKPPDRTMEEAAEDAITAAEILQEALDQREVDEQEGLQS